jgi:nucleoside-diphosphate-sugar epimerase
MKALVTGGGGFLGRAIVEMLLGRGDLVRFIARKKYPDVEALGAEGIQGDIRNLEDVLKACMGMDAVFHTAALPGIWGDIKLYTDINVFGTHNVIEACRRRGVIKLVYTSSPSVVFAMKDECGIDETTPFPQVWFNPYSETKACAEQAVLQSSGRDNLLCCALRPHLLWGPRDTQLLPRLIERARRRQLWIVGKGDNQVDLTYIDNAAMAHLLACDAMTANRVAGQVYFISDDKPVVLWEWINAFLEQLGIRPVTRRMPASVAYGLGWSLERVYRILKKQAEPRMTRFLAKALSCSHYYDISKAKRDFRYKATIGNEEGLRRAVEYFSAQKVES